MLAPVRTVDPTAQPISLDEAKRHLRVEHSEDDLVIDLCVQAAVKHFDGYTGISGRALINQTWRQDYSGFSDRMCLPLSPVSSVLSVTYYNTSNATTTLATSVYRLLTDAAGPYVCLKPDQDWPSSYDREDAVSITFVAGYGAEGRHVPADLRWAILLMIGHYFENREAVLTVPNAMELPLGMKALLAPHRMVGL